MKTDSDWRDTYRSLTPEEQEATQNIPAPKLPTKTTSFALLFANTHPTQFITDAEGREHDEKGLFTEKGGGADRAGLPKSVAADFKSTVPSTAPAGGTIELVKTSSANTKALSKEATEQGIDEMAPIRHVLENGGGSHVLVSRDPDGKINGALAVRYDKNYNLGAVDFRVGTKHTEDSQDVQRKGVGTALMTRAAQLALTTKNQELHHYGSLSSAIPFYQRLGAEYRLGNTRKSFDSSGTMDKEATKALAEGRPIDKRTPDPGEHKLDYDLNGDVIGHNHTGWKDYARDNGTPRRPGEPYAAQTNSFTTLGFYFDYLDDHNITNGPGGRFAPAGSTDESRDSGSGSDIRNFGFEGWASDRKAVVLDTVSKLRDKYPVEGDTILSINAGPKSNVALEVEALAAVEERTPTHIDINPHMSDQRWLEENDPGNTVSSNNLKDVITHEFGHVIEGTMSSSFQRKLEAPFLAAQQSLFDLEDGKGDGAKYQALIKTISEYAGDNVSEGIAEAFLQHELGVHNEYSDHVANVIEQWKAQVQSK